VSEGGGPQQRCHGGPLEQQEPGEKQGTEQQSAVVKPVGRHLAGLKEPRQAREFFGHKGTPRGDESERSVVILEDVDQDFPVWADRLLQAAEVGEHGAPPVLNVASHFAERLISCETVNEDVAAPEGNADQAEAEGRVEAGKGGPRDGQHP